LAKVKIKSEKCFTRSRNASYGKDIGLFAICYKFVIYNKVFFDLKRGKKYEKQAR